MRCYSKKSVSYPVRRTKGTFGDSTTHLTQPRVHRPNDNPTQPVRFCKSALLLQYQPKEQPEHREDQPDQYYQWSFYARGSE